MALSAGASVSTSGGLAVTGNGVLWLDAPFNNGGGGSSLHVGGTLTVNSTNANALYVGNTNIGAGDTVTAGALSNSGVIQIVGAGTIVSTLAINGPATNSGSVNIDGSGDVVMGAGDAYTQAAGATNINTGGTLAGTVAVTGGAVNVVSGGTLAGTANVTGGALDGTGTVVGTVNDLSGGTVFGGLSIGTPGTLTVNGSYDQSGTGDLEANLGAGGTTSGVVADTGGGYVNLTGGTLSVSGPPPVGTVLTVMTFAVGHLVGQFAAIQDGTTAIGDGSFVNLGDGTSIEAFYNNDAGNIQIERVNNSSLATSYNWTDGTANWITAADWSGGQVPNPTANVVIGNTATGNVVLNGSSGDQTVNALSILGSNTLTVSGVTLTSANGVTVAANGSLSLSSGEINGSVLSGAGLLQTNTGNSALAGDTISAHTTFIGQDNTSTELLGAIDNAGTIEQIGGNGQNGVLSIADSVTLTGGGTVLLDTIATDGGNTFIEGITTNQTLTNTNNTILGTGVIGNGNLVLVNHGVIDATPESGTSTLTLNGGGVLNTNLLEATAGGALSIVTNVTNTGGHITATGSLSAVTVSNSATITGGTLSAVSGGTMGSTGNATLQGVTIAAGNLFTAGDNINTTLLGTIDNLGTLEQIGGNGQNGVLAIGGAVTLIGGGTVLLDSIVTNGGDAFIVGNGNTLTNTNNTIVGTGIIGNGSLALINDGVIDAMPKGGTSTLTLNGSGGVTNTNLLEATAGGALSIVTNVTNTGGHITATGSLSVVTVSNSATITGGTLSAVSGGAIGSTGNATLQGVTIAAGNLFTAGDNSTTTLLGTIDNLGTLEQIGGNGQNGVLAISGAVTLTSGGIVLLDDIATNGGNAYIDGNGGTLTNTNNTIVGTGIIGNGSLVLINDGVIDATPESGTSTLTLNGGGGVTNNRLLEATAGGTLSIVTNVTNTGANITATGSLGVVTISSGATITGGTLNTANGGVMDSLNTATLQGVTISAGSLFTASNNTTTTLLGTIDNLGTIEQIGGNGQNGFLSIAGATTLAGGGIVLLDTIATNGGNAYIVGNGGTLTNTNDTIKGTGIIGNGSLVLINHGLIDATPESGTASLTLNAGSITNTSTMEATAGGVLLITTTVNNTGGTITTADATSTVEFSGARVEGGTLRNTAGGTLETTANTTLDGSTQGPLTISSGSVVTSADNITTTLLGTIDNAGTLEQIGGNGQSGFLSIGGAVTLTGGGTVLLDTIATNGGNATLLGNGNTLTNTNNTIEGTGIIGSGNVAVINDGVIDATPEGGTSTLTINTLGAFSSTGTLEATNGATLALNVGAVAVSGLVSVAASSTLDLTGELTVNGTLSNFGAVSGGGATEVAFGSGTDRLIVGPGATFGGNVVGGGVNSTIELAAGTGAGTLNALGTTFTNFGTVIVDAGATWTVDAASSLLATTTFIGDGAGSTLVLSGAGTLNLANVSNFGTIDLPAGNNTVTVTDKTLSGGAVTINDGASGNNTVSAASDTAASKGKSLTYFAGTGTDHFTGGFENDTVKVSAAAVGGDTLTGGTGTNTLTLTSAGSANLGGVSKFPTINLAAGNSTVTVTNTTLSGGTVTINDGASGNNSVTAAGDTSASTGKTLTYNAGSGTDSFTGGFENDTVNVSAAAVGSDTLTGGTGTNTLTLTGAGSANLGGVSKFATINLAAGNSTVTITDKTLSGGPVAVRDGASGNNSVNAVGDTSASTGKSLTWFTGSGTDTFTGGFEDDTVHVPAAAVGGDTLTGGSGNNVLDLTTSGTFNLGGVSKFATVFLAAGNNTVTITANTLSGGTLGLHDTSSGNNSVSAAGDTATSTGKSLTYFTQGGTDSFTGGFENDTVDVSAAAVGGDTLTGGSGNNVVVLTTSGTFSLGGISKFATVFLAAGNNTVTVTDKTLSGGNLGLHDTSSGANSVSAAGDTLASTGRTLTYFAGTGTDSFTGGFENDTVQVSAAAVGGDTLTGGKGVNQLVLTTAGAANLGGASKFGIIYLATGGSALTITDKTLSGGAIALHDASSGNNSVSAAGDTAASTGKTLTYYTQGGTDHFTGGFENDTVRVTAAAISGDTLTGGSGANQVQMTTAGTFSLGGVSKFANVYLVGGNNTVTVTDKTLSGGSVFLHDGATGNNSVSAAGDTSASIGKTLTYQILTGTDIFTGGFENDTLDVQAAHVGGDTLTGGSGNNSLVLTTSGTFSLGGVSKLATIFLAAGNNTVTITDKTLSGGSVGLHAGATGNNTVSASGDTSASNGKTLTYFAGTGTDHFTGGFENDTVRVTAAAVGGDTLTGGSGSNTLVLTTAGTFSLGGVSKFATINLASGNNTVTVTNTTLSGGSVSVAGGAGNNSVSAAGDTAASTGKTLTYHAGTGTDTFTGGFENDTIVAVGAALGTGDAITGGSGTNALVLTGGGTFNLAAPTTLANIPTVNAAEGQAAGGGVPNGVQTVDLRAGLNQTVNVASGTPNPLDPNPETITINGAANNDVINLGAGTDTVVLGGAGETVNGGSGTAFINSTAAFAGALVNGTAGGTTTLKLTNGGSATLNASDSHLIVDLTAATNLTLSQMSFITAVGSTGNDTITALAQGQTLTGGGGTDTLNGFSGIGDVFSDTSAHLNSTTIGNFGGSDLIDLTDMNSATIQPLAYNTTTKTLTVTDGTHTSNIKFTGSYTLSSFQIDGSDGHTGSLIKFV